MITVQIDFALPERFDLTYIDQDGAQNGCSSTVRPWML